MTSGSASRRFFTHWYGRITCTSGRTDATSDPPRAAAAPAGASASAESLTRLVGAMLEGRRNGLGNGPATAAELLRGAAIITIRRYSHPGNSPLVIGRRR